MKKPIIFVTFLVLSILFLSVVQVVVSNSLSTSGLELAKMQKEIAVLQKENYILSEELLFESSLTRIASQAGELGFVDSKAEIYLSTPLPIAVKH